MRILVSLLVPFALVVLYASVRDINGSSSLNGCRMTWMWPDYVHVPIQSRLSKYALFRYQEGGEVKTSRVSVPVLFIPGNAGAYKQARSLGSVANAYANEHFGLRVFTIDSIDELSAFDSHLIKEQAEFTNDAIKSILDSYSSDASYRPTSVIIVAHSMGGIVAKSLFEAHNYVNGSVNSIITLATPHAYPPVAIEQNMVSLYSRLNSFWSDHFSNKAIQHRDFRDLMLLSLAGGDRDAMIQSSYSEINAFVPPSHGFATYSTGVKDVWVSADHRCILWCNQLVHVLVRGLYGMIDFREPSKAVNLGTRIENWRSLLQYSNFEGTRDRVVGGEFAQVPKGKPEFITTKGNLVLAPKRFTPNAYYGVPLLKDTVVKLFVEDVADVGIFGCPDFDMSTANIGQCRSISHLVERIPKRAPKREDGSVDETIGVFAVERSALEPFKSLIVRASGFTTEYGVLLVESSVLNNHKTVEYSTLDALYGKSFDVSTDSVISHIHLPGISASLLAYRLNINVLCDSNQHINSPIMHLNVTGTSEEQWLFAWPDSSYPVSFHKDAANGLKLTLFSKPAKLFGCGPEMKYTIKLQIDYIKTLSLVARRNVNLMLSLVAAIIFVSFLSCIGRASGSDGLSLFCFGILGLGCRFLVKWIAGEASVVDGLASSIIFALAFVVVGIIRSLLFALEFGAKYLAQVTPLYVRSIYIDPIGYTIAKAVFGTILFNFASASTLQAYIFLDTLMVLGCVKSFSTPRNGLMSLLRAGLLVQMLSLLLNSPRLVVWIKDLLVGWRRPQDSMTTDLYDIAVALSSVAFVWVVLFLGKRIDENTITPLRPYVAVGALVFLSVVMISEGPTGTWTIGISMFMAQIAASLLLAFGGLLSPKKSLYEKKLQ